VTDYKSVVVNESSGHILVLWRGLWRKINLSRQSFVSF
jgi:hypothetical protein